MTTTDYQQQAATAAVPGAAGAAGAAGDGRRLRVAVIGLGIGRMHIEGWRQHPSVDVVAIADADADRLARVGDAFGIAARYTDAHALIAAERPDIVSICTPNASHAALALAAFEAGCHVLCEKPMALDAGEGRAMLAAARRAGRRLMINFSYRFSAQSRALKAQVDAGLFGDFYFGRTVWHRRRGLPGFGGWFGSKALAGGGPLIDLGVHRLDLALWLMGHPKPTWVLGSTHDAIATQLAAEAGKAFDVEDLAAALIRFDNGATLVVEASWAAHIGEAELMETRLLGSKAGLLQRNVGEGYTFDAQLFTDLNGAPFDLHLHATGGIGGAATVAPSAMHDFAAAILAGTPHPAPGEEGLAVMEILDAVYASARSGEPVRLS